MVVYVFLKLFPAIDKEKIANARKMFEETTAYEYVKGSLDDLDHVTIRGPPGSGKTTMLLILLDDFKKKRFKVRFVPDLRQFDFRRQVNLKSPTLIVFDDVFGTSVSTPETTSLAQKLLDDIDSHFNFNGNTDPECTRNLLKVVFSTITKIPKDVQPYIKKYKHPLLRDSSIYDVSIDLTFEDKGRILRKHLGSFAHVTMPTEKEIDDISKLEYKYVGFPYICQLFANEGKRECQQF